MANSKPVGALVPSAKAPGVKRTLQFAIEEEESAQVRKWYVVSPRQMRPSNQVAICLFLAGVVQNFGMFIQSLRAFRRARCAVVLSIVCCLVGWLFGWLVGWWLLAVWF